MNRAFVTITAALVAATSIPAANGNTNKGTRSQIVAGQNNTISQGAVNSVVLGGNRNKVGGKGKQAIVAGGQNNLADGTASFAAGNKAQAKHSGTFVWSDGRSSIFSSTGTNQFLIRAQRGVGINTNNPQGRALSVRGNTLLTGNLQVTGDIKGNLTGTTGTFTDLTVTGNLSKVGSSTVFIEGVILSGTNNTASGAFPVVGGGANNVSSADHATVGGGQQNSASGESDTVAGGQANAAGGDWAFIGGGRQNTNGGFAATIAGGELNRAGDAHAAIGGGLSNVIAAGATAAVIGGGAENTAEVSYSVVGGGSGNTIKNGGGIPQLATIGGGGTNLITNSSYASTIGGGVNNKATNEYATIAGGDGNTAGLRATVGGGTGNMAGERASLGGGGNNTASGFAAAIGGGQTNTASGLRSAVGGGFGNTASEDYTVVGGGQNNTASGVGSTVSGGAENTATSNYSAVPGGLNNTASGAYSFAAGRRAKAEHVGTFVWADSTDADFGSGSSNQFLIRAAFTGINRISPMNVTEVFGISSPQTTNYGGMYVRTSGASAKPYYGYSVNGGGNDAWTYVDGSSANKWKLNVGGSDRITVTTNGLIGMGTTTPAHPLQMASGAYVSAGGVWTDVSDVNRKQNFRPIDPKAILAKVVRLPVTRWNYVAEPGVDHIGPMAQDFRAAFGLGNDDKAIGSVDRDGVMYAAIQGLVEELKERDKEIAILKTKSAEVDNLKKKLEMFEERLHSLPPAP